ncbi:MAG: hypothetical protein JWR53_831, partial [Glaciihabitans sp.]|nr:hypothetical protein [Glaciihabitans sp.]
DSPAFDGSAFVTPPVDQQPVAQPPFTPPPFAEPVPQPASPPAQHSDDEPPTMDSLFGALSSTGERPAESAPAPFGDFAPFGADSQVPAPAAVQPPPTEVLPPSEIPDVPPSLPVDGPVPTTASAPPPADEAAPFPFVSGRADLTLTGAAAGTETPESDPNFEPVLPADSLAEQAEVDAPVAAAIAAEPVIAAHPRAFVVEPVGLEPTPLDQRVGRAARLFWMWFATNASVVSVGFGGLVFALGMSLRQSIVATLAGVALSFLPLGLGTLAGKRSGMPTMVISRATFGVTGNVLPAIFGLVSRLFWGAVLLWVLGSGAASILTGASFSGGLTQQQLTLAIVVVGFLLAAVIAFFGYGLIARIQLTISVVAAVLGIGFVALTWHWVSFPTALTVGDGPWILVVTGGVLVFSFVGLVWANSSADLARYQRPGSSGGGSMLWATFGTALPSFLLIAYGAVLAASDPRIAAGLLANPMDQLGRLLPVWYPVPLVLATVLSLLSGVVISVYSAGFALQATGLNLKRPLSVVATGVLLLAIAAGLALTVTDFTSLFRDFATTLAVPIAAWAGIFAAEMMIRNRRFDSVSLLRRGGVYADVRWVNLIALVVITIIGLGLTSATVAGLAWEGYLFTALGIPLSGELAGTDLGVLVALVLGLIVPVVAGVPAIRRQESAERAPE